MAFVQNPRALTCLGVSVGPDGNIYSVGTEGMGVFSLTPAGTLRWTNPEAYVRPIVDYGEIVFGPNGSNQQLYFSANNSPAGSTARRQLRSSRFTAGGQPAIAPDGSVHNSLSAFSPDGNLLWTFPTPLPGQCFHDAGYWERRHPLLRAELDPALCAQSQWLTTLAHHPQRLRRWAGR